MHQSAAMTIQQTTIREYGSNVLDTGKFVPCSGINSYTWEYVGTLNRPVAH